MSEQPRILIVEDDEALRYAASHFLKTKGYSVVDVASSMDALRVMAESDIDVVITDVNLQPKEPHGVALARMVRNKHPDACIVFITGINELESLEPALPGQILQKPFELADLHRTVEELLA